MRMRNYLEPTLSNLRVRIEVGFAASAEGDWGTNTPGGAIEEKAYEYEL
ncbi:MAG: hypothetical protein IJZ49_00410 [Alistipes sp.]|nr:hypothetical protein [Alistipes sp.]